MPVDQDLCRLQQAVGEWALAGSGQNTSRDSTGPAYGYPLGSLAPLLGIIDEAGRLCRVTAARHRDGGPGGAADYQAAKSGAVSGLLLHLCDYCHREGVDIQSVLLETWGKVRGGIESGVAGGNLPDRGPAGWGGNTAALVTGQPAAAAAGPD